MSIADQRRLAAIMFTDMVGFSALAQRDEALSLKLLEEQRSLVRKFLPVHHGREVKTMGDGFLLEFPSALEAVQAAIDIQSALHERNTAVAGNERMQIRIGVHVGDVVSRDGDIHGDGVNIAARIEPLAPPGGICVSNAVFEQVCNKAGRDFASLGVAELKNIDSAMMLHRIVLPWESGEPTAPPPAETAGAWWKLGVPVAVVALVLATWRPWQNRERLPGPAVIVPPTAAPAASKNTNSVAVLAFANLSDDKSNEYFSEGVSEELLNVLAKVPGLNVASRTSAFSFKGKSVPIAEIAKQLGVAYVIEGSVRKSGDRLRITAQLIDAATGFHVWSNNFDRDAKDLFAIQTDVANEVQSALRGKLKLGTAPESVQAGTRNTEAYDLVLRGRYHWNKRKGDDLHRAVGYFQQAAEKDPNYAQAYVGLALSYVGLAQYAGLPPEEGYAKARAAARRALELDPRSGEAHAALAFCTQEEGDFAGAESEFREALRLNPNSATVHHWYTSLLARQGRREEALAEVDRAIALDPLSAPIQSVQGIMLYDQRRYEEALAAVDQALRLDPDLAIARVVRGWIYLAQQKFAAAADEFKTARRTMGDGVVGLPELGYAYGRMERRDEALEVLAQLKKFGDAGVPTRAGRAYVLFGLGQIDEGIQEMELAIQNREAFATDLAEEPHYRFLDGDPRWIAFLKRHGVQR